MLKTPNKLKQYSLQSFFAWPTVLVFVAAVSLFVISSYMGINRFWPIWLSIICNCLASFLAFTVLHEGSHGLVCKNVFLNDLMGQIAMLLLTPAIGFNAYRQVHHYHHLHTNHSVKKDPDFWLATGPKYLYPFKWMMMDSYYFYFYARHLMFKSLRAFMIGTLATGSIAALAFFIYTYNWVWEFLIYSFIPSRLASIYLIWSFAYLPHNPHHQTDDPNPIRTTNVFTGNEKWLTPAFMSHNFHLIHHLYPSIPFYRYKTIWESEKPKLKELGVKVFDKFKKVD